MIVSSKSTALLSLGKDPSLVHGFINSKTKTWSILFPESDYFIVGEFFCGANGLDH